MTDTFENSVCDEPEFDYSNQTPFYDIALSGNQRLKIYEEGGGFFWSMQDRSGQTRRTGDADTIEQALLAGVASVVSVFGELDDLEP